MMDNIVFATDSMRSSVSSLKKKLSNLKISVEQLGSEVEKIETKFDKLLTQTEIYKAKLEREKGREVRRLELELSKLKKQLKETGPVSDSQGDPTELSIASTIAVLECLLRHICEGADDFRLMSYAFLFPAVIERVASSEDPAYFLHKLPQSSQIVINRGKEYVKYLREICETHVTDPEAWEQHVFSVTDWWRNDALPLLYGERDEEWDSDIPLSLAEMLMWRDEPGERPIHFSPVFDAYETYRAHKDEVYNSSEVRAFDLKMFKFGSADPSEERVS
jgi:hypothetical protein